MKKNQTKKKALFVPPDSTFYLPGWDAKQRLDFLEGIQILGLKKLKKLTRHIGTKTLEDVRFASELYKKEVRIRKCIKEIEREVGEMVITGEGHNTWLYSYMSSQTFEGDQRLPSAVLRTFLEQALPRPPSRSTQHLSFPGWRRAEIKDLLAAIDLSSVVTNIAQYIPTKTKLEIVGATQAYAIICVARKHALEMGKHVPTFEELKSGYLYLQCIVSALNEDEKMIKFKNPFYSEPDMARAQFLLKEWLLPDVGTLQNGWTRDEKYLLIAILAKHGSYDLLRIQTYLKWKTTSDLKSAICAIKLEIRMKETSYDKPICKIYLSIACWGLLLSACSETEHKLTAAKRLRSAMLELPDPAASFCAIDLLSPNMTEEDYVSFMLNMHIHDIYFQAADLIPLVEIYITSKKADLEREIEANQMPNTQSN